MASQLAHMSRPGMASESSELKAHAEQSDARHSLHAKVHTVVPAWELCELNAMSNAAVLLKAAEQMALESSRTNGS